MSDNRNRIRLLPLTARHPATVPAAPKGYEALALMWRGEISYLAHEILVRNAHTGTLAGWTGAALRAVDGNKAEAALAALDATQSAETSADDDAEMARMVREWRDRADIPASRAAQMLGLPQRTLEGIEQGRGFRYPRLLALALLAFE